MKIKKSYLYENEQEWLAEYLGPRSYDLNEGMGGPGWRFRWDRDAYYLTIDNEQVGTMFILRFLDERI
jgi:hypothetical protein